MTSLKLKDLRGLLRRDVDVDSTGHDLIDFFILLNLNVFLTNKCMEAIENHTLFTILNKTERL